MRQQQAGIRWDQVPMLAYGFAACAVEGPVEIKRSNRRTPHLEAIDGSSGIIQVSDPGGDERFNIGGRIFFKKEIVVAGNKDLVGKRLPAEPFQEVNDFFSPSFIGKIACMQQHVALGKVQLAMPAVRI